jgi:predicted transposase/invertase (TIGR01784 family)
MKNKKTPIRETTHEENMEKARRYGIKFIDLKIDFAFKFVFGTHGKEDLLLQLIDSILPDKHIVSVTLGPQEQMPDNPEKRRSIYDINCTTESGAHITVEMQCAKQSDFNNRMVYYSSYTLRNTLKRGEDGFEYPELYVIGILDFLLPGVRENPEVVNHYSLRNDRDDGIMLTDTLHYVTIELPKFNKQLDELDGQLDNMLYLFCNLGRMKEIPVYFKDKNLDKLFETTMFANMTQEQQDRYFREFMYEMDQKSRMRTAREDGIAEGRAEGRADTARAMKARGMDTALIADITGLTQDQIAKL